MNLPKRFFLTGTDTEIGKTYVACKLLQRLKNAEAIKPLVSGGMSDIELLHKNSGNKLAIDQRYLYYFDQAIAPHIAAAESEITIEPTKVINFMQQAVAADHILIEGFGGWLAPVTNSTTMADCVIKANIPVILVVGLKLGCINHALLSAHCIKNSGANYLGWIANMIPPTMAFAEQNIASIASYLGDPIDTIL